MEWLSEERQRDLVDLKHSVRDLYAEHVNDEGHPYFTPHDEAHCGCVEEYIKRLIPIDKVEMLSMDERFFLLGSAWLHDIGMMNVFGEKDSKHGATFVRAHHHLRSEEYISSFYTRLKIKADEATIFGILARYHRRKMNIAECQDFISFNGSPVRLRLLAAYVRLADALHTDQSRVPGTHYAIALTYNIPYHSKLHWLKSKLVCGIQIDPHSHSIILDIKKPLNLHHFIENSKRQAEVMRKLDTIVQGNIIRDLQDELDSVVDVLIEHGISYYLRVLGMYQAVFFNVQELRDLVTSLDSRMLLLNPSSSSLYEIVSISLGDIVTDSVSSCDKVVSSLAAFVDDVKKNVALDRYTHYGLLGLLDQVDKCLGCSKIDSSSVEKSINDLKAYLNKRHKDESIANVHLRTVAMNFFEQNYLLVRKDALNRFISEFLVPLLTQDSSFADTRSIAAARILSAVDSKLNEFHRQNGEGQSSNNIIFNVLLYGYSGSVLRSLSGFRDAVMRLIVTSLIEDKNNKYVQPYKLSFERIASLFFRIFVCEGQPKNQTYAYGRTAYHDGWAYSQEILKRNFANVFLIPDAIAGSLFNSESYPNLKPDLVMVGANGFSDDCFTHSAGHYSVLSLCKSSRDNSFVADAILVTSTQKYLAAEKCRVIMNNYAHYSSSQAPPHGSIVAGFPMAMPFANEKLRNTVFLAQDEM